MKKKLNLFVSLLLVLLLGGTLIACNISPKRTVTIAYNPSAYASAVSQIMISENIIEKYLPKNVEVKWVEMSSASDIRDALASGTLDIATPALTAFISAYENNLPIKLISNYGNAQVSLYGCNNEIEDITEFKDSSVIAIKGLNSNPHIALLAYCKEAGLDVRKYNSMLNKIPEAETIGMLASSDDIDGAVLSYPVTKKADALSNCKLLADFSDVIKEYNLGTVVCANSEFYNKNTDIINSFEAAHKFIVENWSANLEKNAKLLAKEYNCPAEEIQDLMESLPPTMEIVGYDKLANLMYECDMLSENPKPFQDVME
nr:ABC transporter substrate-binding protein [uncultured Sellimonas sp.]